MMRMHVTQYSGVSSFLYFKKMVEENYTKHYLISDWNMFIRLTI